MKPTFPPILPESSSSLAGRVWRRNRALLLAVSAVGITAAAPTLPAQVRVEASPAATAAATATKGNLLAVLKAGGKYNAFLKAMEAAGLTPLLDGPGPYTVFAPTDEAFTKLHPGTFDSLLKPENKAKLTAMMNYHLAAGKVMAAALTKMEEFKSLNGEEIDVDTADGKTIEMDDSKIIAPDIEASNGVIHGIDTVLEP